MRFVIDDNKTYLEEIIEIFIGHEISFKLNKIKESDHDISITHPAEKFELIFDITSENQFNKQSAASRIIALAVYNGYGCEYNFDNHTISFKKIFDRGLHDDTSISIENINNETSESIINDSEGGGYNGV